jgi:hypothetical protein
LRESQEVVTDEAQETAWRKHLEAQTYKRVWEEEDVVRVGRLELVGD